MSKVPVAGMLLKLGIDMAIGAVPIIGDLADFGFKANDRNLKLVESREANSPARASDWLVLVGAFAGLFALLGVPVYPIIRILPFILPLNASNALPQRPLQTSTAAASPP